MAYVGGIVKSCETGQGLWTASVFIKGTLTGVQCDGNGNWLWDFSRGFVATGTTMTASAVGYDPVDFPLGNINTQDGQGIWTVICLPTAVVHPISCFTGTTMITLEDGQEKPISEIKIGDFVLGQNGKINQVLNIENPLLGGRMLYSFNDNKPFVTSEHPFYSDLGWKSIDPVATLLENFGFNVKILIPGDKLLKIVGVKVPVQNNSGEILVAVKTEVFLKPETINKINMIKANPQTPLYNLLLNGNNTYYANKYLVHNKH